MSKQSTCALLGACLILLLLNGCQSNSSGTSTSIKEEESVETTQPKETVDQKTIDEKRFVELFEECYEAYQTDGIGADFNYVELEKLYKEYPENEMMRNLYRFCVSNSYFHWAQVLEKPSDIENAKEEAAKIDPKYSGPYSEEVISYAVEVLGEDYAVMAIEANKRQENYDNLSLQDKIDIQNYIADHASMNSDKLWKEIAEMYGISESHVSQVNLDFEVSKAAGAQRASKKKAESENIAYDATLSYGTSRVLVANSKEELDEYFSYLRKEDTSSINSMIFNGQIAYVANNTKVKIVDDGLTVVKVRILEGLYKDCECWTIVEAVHKK